MGLNDTPSSSRIHISFFGRRNAGKSSLVNAITSQELSVVSEVAGTTTDPVSKAMELGELGPVVITDTAGIDDEGDLGLLRIKKTNEVIRKTDIAVIVVDYALGMSKFESELEALLTKKNIPFITIYNKCDTEDAAEDMLCVSARTGRNVDLLKKKIAALKPKQNSLHLVGDFIKSGDVVIFVTPIDQSAPKGRLILPQQQAIRDALDTNAISIVLQPSELKKTIETTKPALVVTDSQVFGEVSKIVPDDIPLTSFSILMARVKGLLESAVKGAYALDTLKDGDKVLISEGCTHHRQCKDIGTVKLPMLIEKHTGAKIEFEFTSGGTFPDDLKEYTLIVHCGGCMLNDNEMHSRVAAAAEQNVPITNYGTAIAHINGILKRSLSIIPLER